MLLHERYMLNRVTNAVQYEIKLSTSTSISYKMPLLMHIKNPEKIKLFFFESLEQTGK
jgi:hypothetical protein